MLFESFDLPVLEFTTSFSRRSLFFDHAVSAISHYDIFKGVIMLSLLWLAWFRRIPGESEEQGDHRRAHLIIVFAGSVVAVIISRMLQLGLHVHLRPLIAGLGLPFPLGDKEEVHHWNSFPSDHAMLFFALSAGLWQSSQRIGASAFAWTTFMICLPRVYMGLHYPSDIIGGALYGIACMMGFERLPVQKPALRLLAWSKRHPGWFYWCAFMASEQVAHLFDDFRNLGVSMIRYIVAGQ